MPTPPFLLFPDLFLYQSDNASDSSAGSTNSCDRMDKCFLMMSCVRIVFHNYCAWCLSVSFLFIILTSWFVFECIVHNPEIDHAYSAYSETLLKRLITFALKWRQEIRQIFTSFSFFSLRRKIIYIVTIISQFRIERKASHLLVSEV